MKISNVFVLLVTTAVAACSSSDGDGIEPDPASSSAAASGSSAASGGQGDSDQNIASLYAWQRFQGEFDTLDQVPLTEDSWAPPERQRFVGCAVDAPELGERVVYVERTALEGDQSPNRQILVAFRADPESEAPTPGARPAAIGSIYQLSDPSAWAGRCQVGSPLTLLSAVSDSEQCSIPLNMNENTNLHVTGPGFSGVCIAASLDGKQVTSIMTIGPERITWTDVDDGNWSDPSTDARSGDERWYEFKRRSPLPALPETTP